MHIDIKDDGSFEEKQENCQCPVCICLYPIGKSLKISDGLQFLFTKESTKV